MKTPLVTIAIPVYNAEKFLRYAIQSVLNQTYQNWELLLLNDGSTDGSVVIMQEFAAKDDRITLFDDGTNRGLISRLNQSIEIAKGEFYARMDADDIMYISRIEEQVKFFQNHSDADVVGTSMMLINDKNEIVGSGYNEGRVNGFFHPTVMARTDWYRNNQYAEWAFRAEDKELWMRTNRNSNFYCVGQPLFFYREFGVPTFRKYALSGKTLLKIYSHYKGYGKSFLWFITNSVQTIVKVIIYAVFAMFGQTDSIVAHRNWGKIPLQKALSSDDLYKSIAES